MSDDYTLPPAAAVDVSRRLMARAWDDDIADDDRLLMEQAAVAIDELAARLYRLAAVIERTEPANGGE